MLNVEDGERYISYLAEASEYDKPLCKWLKLGLLVHTCVTMEISMRSNGVIRSKILKCFLSPNYFLQFENMKEELLVIANNISRGETVTDLCTYRPSSSGGESHLK